MKAPWANISLFWFTHTDLSRAGKKDKTILCAFFIFYRKQN